MQNPLAASVRNPHDSPQSRPELDLSYQDSNLAFSLVHPSLPVLASITVWPPQVNAVDFPCPDVPFYSPVITLVATMIRLDLPTHG